MKPKLVQYFRFSLILWYSIPWNLCTFRRWRAVSSVQSLTFVSSRGFLLLIGQEKLLFSAWMYIKLTVRSKISGRSGWNRLEFVGTWSCSSQCENEREIDEKNHFCLSFSSLELSITASSLVLSSTGSSGIRGNFGSFLVNGTMAKVISAEIITISAAVYKTSTFPPNCSTIRPNTIGAASPRTPDSVDLLF